MARHGVTYQDIANAADQILGQGKQPTIELIRHLLGTGSTTTIANHLRKWRAEQDGSTSVAIKENLPQEFVSMMKGLWQRLQAHADNQIVVAKDEAAQQILHLQQESEKYKINNQRWQKMHEAWIKEKDQLARDKLGLDQAINLIQKDNAALTSKLEAQQNQLNDKQERIEELNRLHKLAQENLEHYRESTRVQRMIDQEKHSQQMQQSEINLKNMEQQLTIVTQEKTALKNQLEIMSADNNLLHNTNDDLSLELNKLQSVYSSLEKEHGEIKRDVIHYQTHHEKLQKKLDEQTALLLEQQKNNAVISQQLLNVTKEVSDLKDQNKFLAREKWEIAQEKAQIEGVNQQMQKMIQAKELC